MVVKGGVGVGRDGGIGVGGDVEGDEQSKVILLFPYLPGVCPLYLSQHNTALLSPTFAT